MAHKIVLCPDYGYFGGKFENGPMSGRLVGWELADLLVQGIVDELNIEGIEHQVIATRKAPGLTAEQRDGLMEVGHIVLSIGVGRNGEDAVSVQASRVTHKKGAKMLAGRLMGSMMRWGRAVNFLHADGGVELDNALHPGARSSDVVRVEPFIVDAMSASDYATQLDRLGRDLGRTLVSYIRESNPGLGVKGMRRVTEKQWVVEGSTPHRVPAPPPPSEVPQ